MRRLPPRRTLSVVFAFLVLAGCGTGSRDAGSRQPLRDERLKMGTRFEIQLVTDDIAAGRAAIEAAYAEIDRVEQLLSEWRESSEISAVNRQAGQGAVSVGPDLFAVIERSVRISEITQGAFDVTFAGCGRIWSIPRPVPSTPRWRRCNRTKYWKPISQVCPDCFPDASTTRLIPR